MPEAAFDRKHLTHAHTHTHTPASPFNLQGPWVARFPSPEHESDVGWINHMASPRCPDGEQCLWRRAQWTAHEMGIKTEDLAAWIQDAKRVMGQAHSCPAFTITLRFVPVRRALEACQVVAGSRLGAGCVGACMQV